VKRLGVAVVQGGPSSEAEVSRASAASVAHALTATGHDVSRLELDARLPKALRGGGFDVVFPVVHGAVGEDGSLQGLLELLELPYVGSGVLASAVAMNKRVAKVLLAAEGLPVAAGIAASRPDDEGALAPAARAAAARALRDLGSAVVVKPCANGSAIGVARFAAGTDEAALAHAIAAAWEVDDVALVERFAAGREITCGVLETLEDAHGAALPPTEIRAPKDAFYTYEARYAPGRSEHLCPAPLGAELGRRIQEIAVQAHRALGCRDLSRVDFIVGEDEVTLLEVNTMPGFTDTSLFPEAAGASGLTMPELCRGLVTRAHQRGAARRNTPLALPTG
jgi:D-alanine-D-alanine ligase